jgi:hypothetical protein
MIRRLQLCLILFVVCTVVCWCDETYYVDSIAAFSANSNTNLLDPPTAKNEIITSHRYESETSGDIQITYVGTFANSGPHSLGTFARGSTKLVDIPLSRKIGDLVKVILENSGADSWLMTTLYCQIDQIRYELRSPKVWLESVDPESEALYEDAFSPDAHVTQPSASKLELPVHDKHIVYTYTGIL